jgi:uncharacterized protein
MPTVTQHAPGTFCWPELATKDAKAAKEFYAPLFGWNYDDQDMGSDGVYSMIQKDGKNVGAMYTMKQDAATPAGTPPHWGSYVSVESADASAAKAKQLGGTLMMEPFDVMEHGRMAVIRDPQGAVFCVWQPKKHIGAHVLGEPGSLVWTELMTTDAKAAEAFYTGLFPWKTKKMDSATGGPYTIFHVGENGTGGMLQITPEMGKMPTHWYPYFAVADCDAVVIQAKGQGAKVFVPPTDIPQTGRFSVLQDPQGAVFAVIKPEPM